VPPGARPAAAKWAAIAGVLRAGYAVLYAGPGVALLQDPFPLLAGDVDLEALPYEDASHTAAAAAGARLESGAIRACWAQLLCAAACPEQDGFLCPAAALPNPSTAVVRPAAPSPGAEQRAFSQPGLCPGLLFLRPTPAALALATAMLEDLETGAPEGPLLNAAALSASRGAPDRSASLRLLPRRHFLDASGLFPPAGGGAPLPGGALAPAAQLLRQLGQGRGELAAVHVGGGGGGPGGRAARLAAVAEAAGGSASALGALLGGVGDGLRTISAGSSGGLHGLTRW
jgi:hypothetical protein